MAGLGPSLPQPRAGASLVMNSQADNLIADEKRRPAALNLTPTRTGSSGSSSSEDSLKPRTPRFAEATSVHSPIEGHNPFAEKSYVPQAQPGDIGFGYINSDNHRESIPVPMTPKTPLRSAMKVPGTPARMNNNPLSPTFREEDILEKREASTDKEQARDVVCFFLPGDHNYLWNSTNTAQ